VTSVDNPSFTIVTNPDRAQGVAAIFTQATSPLATATVSVPQGGISGSLGPGTHTYALIVTTTGAAALTTDAEDGEGATLVIGACYTTDSASYCNPDSLSPKWQVRVVSTSKVSTNGATTNALPLSYSWSGNWMITSISPSTDAPIQYVVRVYYRSEFHNVGTQPANVAKWKILQDPQSYLNVLLLQLS